MPASVNPEGTIFDHIFGFFRSASELGATWGEPWGLLFPVLILVFLSFVVVGGFRYTTEILQEQLFKKLLFGAVILTGLYIVTSFNV